jgi:hypothetical protein
LPLGLNDLLLQEVFILLEGVASGGPVLDFFIQIVFFLFRFDLSLIQLRYRLLELVYEIVFE